MAKEPTEAKSNWHSVTLTVAPASEIVTEPNKTQRSKERATVCIGSKRPNTFISLPSAQDFLVSSPQLAALPQTRLRRRPGVGPLQATHWTREMPRLFTERGELPLAGSRGCCIQRATRQGGRQRLLAGTSLGTGIRGCQAGCERQRSHAVPSSGRQGLGRPRPGDCLWAAWSSWSVCTSNSAYALASQLTCSDIPGRTNHEHG